MPLPRVYRKGLPDGLHAAGNDLFSVTESFIMKKGAPDAEFER
jgi:hypothetical protein